MRKKIYVIVIDSLPYAGYRTVAWLLGENKNTVQRIFQIKSWQVRKRRSGHRPRVQSLPSVASRPNERWATDMARVWCGEQHRWCALTVVMDCYTGELLGWRLSPTGKAKDSLTIRSDNGLVFCSRRYTQTVYRYGLQQEFIRPHTPQQNGMVERLIRSVKEQCIWLHNFASLDEARQALGAWFHYYNHERPHQALKMKTPRQMYQLAA
ncbi:MAG: integrase core domain-containing protein [Pseudomonadota bacterium]